MSQTLLTIFFDGDYRKATRDLVKKILSLVRKSNLEDVVDFIKLWVPFLFITIMFPIAHYNLFKALFSYVDDLNSLGIYS